MPNETIVDVQIDKGVAAFLRAAQSEIAAAEAIVETKRNGNTRLVASIVSANGKGALENYVGVAVADTDQGPVIRLTLREDPPRPAPLNPTEE